MYARMGWVINLMELRELNHFLVQSHNYRILMSKLSHIFSSLNIHTLQLIDHCSYGSTPCFMCNYILIINPFNFLKSHLALSPMVIVHILPVSLWSGSSLKLACMFMVLPTPKLSTFEYLGYSPPTLIVHLENISTSFKFDMVLLIQIHLCLANHYFLCSSWAIPWKNVFESYMGSLRPHPCSKTPPFCGSMYNHSKFTTKHLGMLPLIYLKVLAYYYQKLCLFLVLLSWMFNN